MASIYPVIGAADIERSAGFYRRLLGLQDTFVSDWYISLASADGRQQIALVERGHETIPDGFRSAPQGVIVTVEVDDVDAVHARAAAAGSRIALPLRDEDWGQRHFIVVDPDGLLVDVITVIAPSGEYAAGYTDLARLT